MPARRLRAFLDPTACLRGELVMNGSPYRALLAVQGYMDRFTPSLIGGGQEHHRLLRARGPGVDEAILQCCWATPRSASVTVRTSNLAYGNFCRFVLRATCATRYLATDSYLDCQSWDLS